MSNKLKLLAAGSSIALVALGASPALAGGTLAGSIITNTATVDYKVGGVTQTTASATNTLTVDRKVDIRNIAVDAAPVTVVPGQLNAVTVFTITNKSNSIMDIGLAAATQGSGTVGLYNATPTTYTANFLPPSSIVFHTGSAAGAVITYLDEVPIDGSVTIYAVDTSAIPLSATNGQYGGITVTATAQQGGVSGTQGSNVSQSTPYANGAVTVSNQPSNNVFAEPAGYGTDVLNNGIAVASDVWVISAPVLTVTKYSYVVWDPINGTTSPKSIPGAEVRYCIAVSNAAGGATATNVTVGDTLPTQVTGVVGSGFINGTYGAACNTGAYVNGANTTAATGTGTSGASGGTITATSASGTLANLAAGTTETLYFDVTIN